MTRSLTGWIKYTIQAEIQREHGIRGELLWDLQRQLLMGQHNALRAVTIAEITRVNP